MRVELSCVPAIHLRDKCVAPQRRTWDVIASDTELASLSRAADAIAERGGQFPIDADSVRALASAIEVVQLVVRREKGPVE